MKITDTKSRIGELMEMYQLTQSAFCERTKIAKSALSNYLNGDRVPRQDQVSKIADAFNISAAWVMGYDVPIRDPSPSDTRPIQVIDSEWEALQDYFLLDSWGKHAVLDTINRELERCNAQNKKED